MKEVRQQHTIIQHSGLEQGHYTSQRKRERDQSNGKNVSSNFNRKYGGDEHIELSVAGVLTASQDSTWKLSLGSKS